MRKQTAKRAPPRNTHNAIRTAWCLWKFTGIVDDWQHGVEDRGVADYAPVMTDSLACRPGSCVAICRHRSPFAAQSGQLSSTGK